MDEINYPSRAEIATILSSMDLSSKLIAPKSAGYKWKDGNYFETPDSAAADIYQFIQTVRDEHCSAGRVVEVGFRESEFFRGPGRLCMMITISHPQHSGTISINSFIVRFQDGFKVW